MNHFFSCQKQNSSSTNILSNSENSKINKEGKLSNNNEKKDSTEKKKLFLKHDYNESIYNLEIIDYPYSSNNNDDATVKMNSSFKGQNENNLINHKEKETNQNLILNPKENQYIKNYYFNKYQNTSDNSSGIINNEDSLVQNKMLFHNYYINYNLIHINNINKSNEPPNPKEEKSNIFNKMNKNENKPMDKLLGVKVECPQPDLPQFSEKSKTTMLKTILNKTDCSNNNIRKNYIKDLKNNQKISKNKTTEFNRKKKEKIKYKKIIEKNDFYIGNKGNITKNNSKIYNTYSIYINKSYNNIKEHKLYKGKLKNIMNKKIQNMTINCIKIKKSLNTCNTNKTIENIEQKRKKGNGIIPHIKNIAKSKPMYSSNANFNSTLLNKMNKELDTIRNNFLITGNKIVINKKAKNQNIKNKKIYKKLNLNPFSVEEKIYK